MDDLPDINGTRSSSQAQTAHQELLYLYISAIIKIEEFEERPSIINIQAQHLKVCLNIRRFDLFFEGCEGDGL